MSFSEELSRIADAVLDLINSKARTPWAPPVPPVRIWLHGPFQCPPHCRERQGSSFNRSNSWPKCVT